MDEKVNNLNNFFSTEKWTKYFVPALIFLCVVSFVIFALLIIGSVSLNKKENVIINKKINYFKNIRLEAKSAIVLDVINNRELFSKNPDLPLPLASLTKVLTAILTSKKLGDNQIIKITIKDLGAEGDSKLIVEDTWQARDLRDFTLLTSSNDGASALAASAEARSSNNTAIEAENNKLKFVKAMNDTASAIGLSNSKFFNEHGLDRATDKGGSYGSARDIANLFKYAIKNYPDLLEATRYKTLQFSSTKKTYTAKNTNVFVDKIPNIIASKTGFTDLAGGNLVIAFNADLNRPIIISILGSTEEGRFTDVLRLVETTIKQLPNL